MALQRNLLEIFIFFLQTNFDRTIKTGEKNVKNEFFFFFGGGEQKKKRKVYAAGSSDRCKLPVSGVSRCTGFLFCFARHGLCVDGMTV